MARTEMLTVYCSDVERARARRRVAKVLEARCVRVQRSVFEARLAAHEAEALLGAAAAELGPGDSLRMYAVGAHGLERSAAIGGAPLAADEPYWLV
jgi:CRISPR-associated protein Cas2